MRAKLVYFESLHRIYPLQKLRIVVKYAEDFETSHKVNLKRTVSNLYFVAVFDLNHELVTIDSPILTKAGCGDISADIHPLRSYTFDTNAHKSIEYSVTETCREQTC